MFRHSLIRRPLAGMLLGLTLGGCYDWRVEARPVVDVISRASGGVIRVHLKDGTHLKDARNIDVTDVVVTNDTLRGMPASGWPRVAIPVQDIESVSKRHYDVVKSIMATMFVVATFLKIMTRVSGGGVSG